jgi:hypothetical protein
VSLQVRDLAQYGRVILGEYVVPIGFALALLFALYVSAQRAGELFSWNEDYAGVGSFLVEGCQPVLQTGPDQWSCRGLFTAEDGTTSRAQSLVTSNGSLTSDRPYVGQQVDVFHRTGDNSIVHPETIRLNEVLLAYLRLLPPILVLVGSAFWVAGWLLTRHRSIDDFVARDSMMLPQRFGWQSRGVTWLIAAAVMTVVNFAVATWLIGSVGLA